MSVEETSATVATTRGIHAEMKAASKRDGVSLSDYIGGLLADGKLGSSLAKIRITTYLTRDDKVSYLSMAKALRVTLSDYIRALHITREAAYRARLTDEANKRAEGALRDIRTVIEAPDPLGVISLLKTKYGGAEMDATVATNRKK